MSKFDLLAQKSQQVEFILTEYDNILRKKCLFILLVIILTLGLAVISICIGPLDISSSDVFKVILNNVFFLEDNTIEPIINNTVWQVRLPRVLGGFFVGFALAISGAVLQSVLKNPMASPFTLGVSSAAAFGASLSIALSIEPRFLQFSTIVGAFIFALLAIFIIIIMHKKKNVSAETIILTGIAISYLFKAGTTVLQYLVDPIFTKQMVFWESGSLYKSNWQNLYFIIPVVSLLSLFLIIKSKKLNAIVAGDEVAKSIGINVERERFIMLLVSALITAVVVSFMGAIGFIGLIAPHIVRLIIGGDNFFVVIASAFVGAFLLSFSDIVALHIIAPIVLPIGVVTTCMGVPLFFYLIIKRRGGF